MFLSIFLSAHGYKNNNLGYFCKLFLVILITVLAISISITKKKAVELNIIKLLC